jgi:transposase InsO family protein
MDWNSPNADEAYENFKDVCTLIFEGPLDDVSEERQVRYLKLWSGEEGRALIKTWALSVADAKKLENYWAKFKDYVKPKSNFRVARFKLRSYRQSDSEPVDSFVKRLRTIIAECKYPKEHEKEHLIDSLIFGIQSEKVQGTLLQKDDKLTIDDALTLARTEEATTQQLSVIRGKSAKTEVSAVAKTQKRTQYNKGWSQKKTRDEAPAHPRRCGYCSYDMHSSGETCPAKGATCIKCGKKGHWKRACRSKGTTSKSVAPSDTEKRSSKINELQSRINELQHGAPLPRDDDDHSLLFSPLPSDDDEVYYHFQPVFFDSVEETAQAMIDLPISSDECTRVIKCKIDTGAEGNLIPLHVLKTIVPCQPDGEPQGLQPSQTRLIAYGNNAIEQMGVCQLELMHHSKKHDTTFFVTRSTGPVLLGLPTCLKLGLVTLHHEITTDKRTAKRPAKPQGDLNIRQKILREYSDVFKGIGCFDGECHITIDKNVPPVIHPPRRIPVALRGALKEELGSLVAQGILSPVTHPTDWVNSCVCVTKPNGKLRLCLDPKDLNKAVKRPHYVTPTLEDVISRLSGAKWFSILDARSGYWNIKLDDASADLTTFNTTFGRFRFNRLPMGICCAQDEFQRMIDNTFGDIPNTLGIADDLIIFGYEEDGSDHDQALKAVLDRARKRGPKFNEDKMILRCQEIPFFGHLVGCNGIRPDPAKISAIQSMGPPADLKELQTFLGMVNYLHRYSPQLANITAPLRDLCKSKSEFIWGPEHDLAMQKVKDEITSAGHLPFYDPHKQLILQVDASGRGLGASLIQDKGPIAFASKALSDAETRYSNIERELLAIVWGLEKFHYYVYGRDVNVHTDHKPLESISQKNLASAPPRLARMLLRAQRYSFTVSYIPGKDIPLADALSRISPHDKGEVKGLNLSVHSIQPYVNATPTRLAQVREETEKDPQLALLKETIMAGWPETHSDCPGPLLSYWNFRDELGVEDGVIVKGSRLVIPQSLKTEVLKQIHCGHLGIEKCRLRARSAVYWAGIYQDIEQLVSSCSICQEHQASQTKEPLLPNEVPPYAWHTIATDLFTWEQKTYLLVADAYSRYPLVRRMHSLSSASVINLMRSMFDEHGIPQIVKSDNGPQYSSEEFKRFALQYGFRHITSSPHYPKSNGFIERMVQTVKRLFRKARKSNSDPHLAMLAYRATPFDHNTPSPAELLTGRKFHTTLLQKGQVTSPDTRDKFLKNKEKMKAYHDKCTRTLPPLIPKQLVRVQDPDTKKWIPGQIENTTSEPRSYVVKTPKGTYRRNRRHLRTTREQLTGIKNSSQVYPDTSHEGVPPSACEHDTGQAEPPASPEPALRRSSRNVKPPDRLDL